MKIRYPGIFGVLAILMMVASFIMPAKLASPAPAEALDTICQWDVVSTPGMIAGLAWDIASPAEGNQLVICNDGRTMWLVDRATPTTAAATGLGAPWGPGNVLKSTNGGITWSDRPAGTSTFGYLRNTMQATGLGSYPVWFIAVAPDDCNFVVAITDNVGAAVTGPTMVWISEDGGTTWQNTAFAFLSGLELISCLDVSMKYGNTRDIVVGTRTLTGLGAAGGNVYVLKAPGYSGWRAQIGLAPSTNLPDGTILGSATADVYAVKCSPTYVGDATIVIVDSPIGLVGDTFLHMGLRDLAATNPTTAWNAIYDRTEIIPTGAAPFTSPGAAAMSQADLELPSDFSGASASMRRAYVSTDAAGATVGVFRVDDTTVYQLMNTTGLVTKRINSITYWGTYASGKLLVGEVVGNSCTATVPTWFTDSPTVCPVPCWYPALKPTTGAANQVACAPNAIGMGNAFVVWSPTFADQGVAYVVTSSAWYGLGGWGWGAGMLPNGWLTSVQYDESAFGLTRNNGETWNQLGYIDTFIYKFTDVAPAPDCGIVYLASTNNMTDTTTPIFCVGFDSVWRSGTNSAVQTPPLPGLPLGTYWERVLTHFTSISCNQTESQHAILRLAPDKFDGQILFWAAGGTGGLPATFTPVGCPGPGILPGTSNMDFGPNTRAVMWTPDYGDYWATITPRLAVQDLAAASSTLIYIGETTGRIQPMPYTGTAWSSAELDRDAFIPIHMVAARYDPVNKKTSDWVMVGDNGAFSAIAPVTWSSDGYRTFGYNAVPTGEPASRVHVAFDSKFEINKIIYAAFQNVAAAGGGIWRFAIGKGTDWDDLLGAGAGGIFHGVGYFGLATAFTGYSPWSSGALYAAHNIAFTIPAGVDRTLEPIAGMPKPGLAWDCLNWFAQTPGAGTDCLPSTVGCTQFVWFTEEPYSLKLCGCLTMDTDTNLFGIDNSNMYVTTGTGGRGPGMGNLWMFTDCMAKKGPKLIMADKTLVGCDPVSGRNQEINFTWEQLCLASSYDIEIAKDNNFQQSVFLFASAPPAPVPPVLCAACPVGFVPPLLTSPAFIFPVGSGVGAAVWGALPPALVSALECGHTYYWHVQARCCITGQIIRSPWSETRSFTVKAGLPVSMPYYGLQLLAPDNGCIGCPVKPASFSWSPYKETAKYKFQLAKDAAMTQIVVEATTTTTGYEYVGTLDYSANYFWRVMSVEPAPSDWSATFSFMTAAAPAPPAKDPAPAPTPLWVWVVIAIGAILVIVTLVLIFRTRQV